MQDFNQANIILHRRRVLKAIKNCGAISIASQAYIAAAETLEDQVRKAFEVTVPLLHVGHGFAKVFVVGNGDMDRVDPAGAHLFKNFFRPVGILQRVDAIGPFNNLIPAHSGLPLEI